MKSEVLAKALTKIMKTQKEMQDSLDSVVEAVNLMIEIMEMQSGRKRDGPKHHR